MSEREPYPSEKQDRFIVRLPDGMRDRIKVAAESNNRSMNAEIVATLEKEYPPPSILLREQFAAEIERILKLPAEQQEEEVRRINEQLKTERLGQSISIVDGTLHLHLSGPALDDFRSNLDARRRASHRSEAGDGFGDGTGYGYSDGQGDGFGDGNGDGSGEG